MSLVSISGGKLGGDKTPTQPETPSFTYVVTLKNGKSTTWDGYLVCTGTFVAIATGDNGDILYLTPLDAVQDIELVPDE